LTEDVFTKVITYYRCKEITCKEKDDPAAPPPEKCVTCKRALEGGAKPKKIKKEATTTQNWNMMWDDFLLPQREFISDLNPDRQARLGATFCRNSGTANFTPLTLENFEFLWKLNEAAAAKPEPKARMKKRRDRTE